MIDSNQLVPLLVQYQLLPQLLRELTIDDAIAAVTLTDEERSQAEAQFDEQHQLTSDADHQAWMQQRGISSAQFEQIITRPWRIEKFKLLTWGNRLDSYFLIQKPQYDQVTYSLLRTPDPEIAQELYFRIKAGEQTFAELAREYSQGAEAETEGVIGPVSMSQPHPALAQRLRHSQPGQILPPTRMGEWFVLLRLEAITPAQLDAAMRQKLLDELFEAWITQALSQPPKTTQPALALSAERLA
jgi:parvulin-like peptidyl-prolyl isomerase